MAKKTIVISQGHLYLFWATGVYYISELMRDFNIILILPEEYQEDTKFCNVIAKLNVKAIYYFKDSVYFCQKRHKWSAFRRQVHYAKLFQSVVLEHRPEYVLQHDYIGLENMYLFHWAKKYLPDCSNIVILSSQPSNENIIPGFIKFRADNVRKIAARFRLPERFVSLSVSCIKYSRSFIQNVIIPFVLLREKPYFPPSLFSNIDIVPRKLLFDYFLVYEECEKQYLENLLGINGPIRIIQSPVIDRYNIDCKIYNKYEESFIVFLPSLIGLQEFKQEEVFIDKWVLALNLLRDQFPDFEFIMKFHPGNKSDDLKYVKTYLKKKCSFISFIQSSTRAEELILQSRIVVGDASTTLWWASMKGEKLVISLDMRNCPVSSDMNRYSDILCVDDMRFLEEMDLRGMCASKKNASRASGCLGLLEFIQGLKPKILDNDSAIS